MSVYRPSYTDPKTGEKREQDVFWCDFTYKRQRIRESTGQTKKMLAKDYETWRRRELENAVAGVKAPKPEERIQTVKAVVQAWLTIRTVGKRDKTKAYIRERCAHLIDDLGGKLVCDITETVVAEYIGKREAEGAAAVSINREVFLLSRAPRWTGRRPGRTLAVQDGRKSQSGKRLMTMKRRRCWKRPARIGASTHCRISRSPVHRLPRGRGPHISVASFRLLRGLDSLRDQQDTGRRIPGSADVTGAGGHPTRAPGMDRREAGSGARTG